MFAKALSFIWENTVGTVVFSGSVFLAAVEVIRDPRKLRVRDLLYYIDLCGTRSLPIVIIICYLMGLILGFQSAVQMQKFGTEIYVADLVGFSILKELGPLMVAMICTGRAGSAFAAEIGTMQTDDEVSALSTMGIVPERFLVIPKLLAMLIAMPLLTIFGDIAGLVGGWTVGVYYLDLPSVAYFDRTIAVLKPSTFLMGVNKTFLFAILITLVGCRQGFLSSPDAQGVGRAATGAVVMSVFMVVVADAVLTFIYLLFGY